MKHSRASKNVLKALIDGNQRFLSGVKSVSSIATPEKLKYLSDHGQNPSCIVLACSDSRVPIELIFDQGLGDLFVVRVAGNVVAPSLIASMEFAVDTFNSPLLLVLGHTKCGAIQAACKHNHESSLTLGKNLNDLMSRIRPAVERSKHHAPNSQKVIEHCTTANVSNSISEIIRNSPLISQKIENKELEIIGAVFELETGKVLFFEEAQFLLGDEASENLHLCTH